jgi:LysM repeat protein
MRILREAFGGIFLAAITALTVMGGIFLALNETGNVVSTPALIAAVTAEPTEAASPVKPTATATFTPTPSPTVVTPTSTPTHTPMPTVEPVLLETATPCAPPRNWVTYVVQRGDTLFEIGRRYGLTTQEIQQANCLTETSLKAGQRLFVPALPTAPPSPAPTETATPIPTETPIPETLAILHVVLESVERDPSRPNGAVAIIRIEFAGGAPPFTFSDEGVVQPGNPIRVLADCDGALIHTVRLDSADGQVAVKSYYFSPITCP